MSWVTNVGPELHFDYNLKQMLSAHVFQPGKKQTLSKANSIIVLCMLSLPLFVEISTSSDELYLAYILSRHQNHYIYFQSKLR